MVWLKRIGLVIVGLLLLGVIGTAGASKLEERDSFCTSCHLAPETTYRERTTAALVVADPIELTDLASFHYWAAANDETAAPFRCIDCHRGDHSLEHRGRVLLLAAGDTLTFLSGQADETTEKGNVVNANPNVEPWHGPDEYNRAPDILDAGCLHCHQDTLTLVGFNNHFHNKLPAAQLAYQQTGKLHYPPEWGGLMDTPDLLQAEETILTCLDCHRAHVTGYQFDYFLDENNVVLPACVQCHLEVDKGPADLLR
jgi:hypothetical protein